MARPYYTARQKSGKPTIATVAIFVSRETRKFLFRTNFVSRETRKFLFRTNFVSRETLLLARIVDKAGDKLVDTLLIESGQAVNSRG